MNALAQFYAPWYQNTGPTEKEMKISIIEALLDKPIKEKLPYLYIKSVRESINEMDKFPLVSWRGWYQEKKNIINTPLLNIIDDKYKIKEKEWAVKKLSILLIPYINHRLYRFPDGLRIKKVRESWYQGII
jgi:hypothetical protein